jgi:hypothetical protein
MVSFRALDDELAVESFPLLSSAFTTSRGAAGIDCVTRNLHAPLWRPATLAALAMGAIMSKRANTQAEPWTESDIAELQAFVAEEMSVDEMAEELGRSVAAIRAKAAEEGIELSASAADAESDE